MSGVLSPVPQFGDQVRIKETSDTLQAGLAGWEGEVFGVTTPSVTGVAVVGGAPDDVALNVHFRERNIDHWFRPDLIEVLHHNVGAEMTIQGASVKWVRQADGSWGEVPMNKGARGGLVALLRRLFGR
jgi:hypothetical protein